MLNEHDVWVERLAYLEPYTDYISGGAPLVYDFHYSILIFVSSLSSRMYQSMAKVNVIPKIFPLIPGSFKFFKM